MAVLCGIDVLERDEYRLLKGARVGLITNHTGRTRTGLHTLDALLRGGVDVRALFAPEHGIRGDLDAEIADGMDEATGLPVHSLYNPTEKRFAPTAQQLEGLDCLLFDVQDVGVRFYTYSATLGYAMEAAEACGLRFIVLDRPNPINGVVTEGNIAEEKRLGFTAYHTIPLRHGLTLGELAILYKKDRVPNVFLDVVCCEGWRRAMWWDECDLAWINPSPNIRSLTQATLYPGIGMLEFTNLSVGRGTDNPFEQVGAPWLDGKRLASELNALQMPGFQCNAAEFTPTSSQYCGERCGAVSFRVTDRERFSSVQLGSEIAHLLANGQPEWEPHRLSMLTHSQQYADAILSGGWLGAQRFAHRDLIDFAQKCTHCLLYAH